MKLRNLQSRWERFASTDPLWAILTDPQRKDGRWDVAEFFATGAQSVDEILQSAAPLGVPAERAAALDFGCGVGRLTQALAARFDRVTGVDIAPSMIELAQKYNRHGDRCRYLVNDRADLSILKDSSFDLVCSIITLQHMTPSRSTAYLREFVRVLKPGGLLVFQLPDSLRSSIRALAYPAWRFLLCSILHRADAMQMYGVPRSQVESLLKECGARVLSCREDGCAGDIWLDYRYFVTR